MEYGLIGEKLGHSFSKIIHNELFSYNYELKEIKPEEFDEFMRKADFKAINVTIPYKEMVMEYLDEISEKAKEIGAVNVVVNDDGKLIGYNTDFLGLKGLIQKNNIDLKDKKVLILGSGGTSKTALAVCRDLGAQQAFRVSRSGGNGLITYDEAEKVDADIIINTTPCGMYPNIEGAAIDIDKFDGLSAVVDVVYNPLNTDLIVKAKAKGIKAVGGLYMLVAQAIFAAEKFGFKVKEEDFERVYNKIFKEKQNLVLIGMPTSGKTTIGKILSEELGREFIDSDEEIVEKIGMSISEFFEKNGEAEFRKIEAQVIKEIALKQGAVIATGGGVILNKRNIELLKMNGKVIFLNRPLDMLLTSEDRPLSSDRELLKKRFEERHEIYKASADVEIIADSDIKTNVQKVKEGF
jgi:shikimate dehydrogenase